MGVSRCSATISIYLIDDDETKRRAAYPLLMVGWCLLVSAQAVQQSYPKLFKVIFLAPSLISRGGDER
jgi:hypothetical protein